MTRFSRWSHSFKKQNLLKNISEGTVLVAVSGGADSVALANLLREISVEKKWNLVLAHVEHALRAQRSLDDAAFVKKLAKKWNVACIVAQVNVPEYARKMKLGTEQAARILRYAELSKMAKRCGAHSIFVAHHADDQAETLLLNLMRGSGLSGLSGIKSLRPLSEITGKKTDEKIQVVRPMLEFKKQEILEYLKSCGLNYVQDSTNFEVIYRRNWIRSEVVPLLQKHQPQIIGNLANSAKIFQWQQEYLDAQCLKMQNKIVRKNSEIVRGENQIYFSAGSLLELGLFFRYDIALRFHWLHRLFPAAAYRQIFAAHFFLTRQKKQRMELDKLARFFEGQQTLKKPDQVPETEFAVPGNVILKEWNLKVCSRIFKRVGRQNFLDKKEKFIFWMDWDKLGADSKNLRCVIRAWRAGDRFFPWGMTGSKKVQDFFVDEKVSRLERTRVPILEVNGKICWMVGYRAAAEFEVDAQTRRILEVKVKFM